MPAALPEPKRIIQKSRRRQPKTFVDATDGSERPTRIGKKYTVDHSTGEVSYKRVKSAQLSQSIQLGIRTMVASITSKKGRDLLHTDFSEVESRYFPSSGSSNTVPHHNSDFKFYSYAPYAFRLFREHFGINTAEFMLSLCDKPLIPLSNPGASGSVFYLSYDDTFIVKTVQKSEHTFMMRLLPGYYMNLVQNKKTLLPKFFGLFCYQNALGKNIRFVVMNNLVPSRLSYYQRFDLKGSTKGRTASEKERRKKSPTYKDLDFIDMHTFGFVLSQATYDRLKETLYRDVLVLESFRIMDYSLFVGVHRVGIDEVRASRIDTDSEYTDGEDDVHISPPSLSMESNAVTIKLSGCSGDLRYINGVYEQLAHGALVHGRPGFKRINPIPAGNGAMSGSPLYLHFNAEENIWRLSSALDRANMAILLMSTPGDYNSPLDVPPGCWKVLASEGVHEIDYNITAEIEACRTSRASDASIVTARNHRRRSMSFATLTEQLDLTPAQSQIYNVDGDASICDDPYTGGLHLKFRNQSGNVVDAVAYLGIIDILQNFRLSKRLEHRFKKIMYDGDTCSVHNPRFYRKRFQNFMCDPTSGVFRPELPPNNDDKSSTKNQGAPKKIMSGFANPNYAHPRRDSANHNKRNDSNSSQGGRKRESLSRSSSVGSQRLMKHKGPSLPETRILPTNMDLPVAAPYIDAANTNSTSDIYDETKIYSSNEMKLETSQLSLRETSATNWPEPYSPSSSPISDVNSKSVGVVRHSQGTKFTADVSTDEAVELKAQIAAARATRKSLRMNLSEKDPEIFLPTNGSNSRGHIEELIIKVERSTQSKELDEFVMLEEQSSDIKPDSSLQHKSQVTIFPLSQALSPERTSELNPTTTSHQTSPRKGTLV